MIINLDVFDKTIYFYTNKSSFIKRSGCNIDMSTSDGMYYNDCIWIEKYNIGTIIHECSHCVKDIMEELGIEDSETWAYTMEYICTKILYSEKVIKCI